MKRPAAAEVIKSDWGDEVTLLLGAAHQFGLVGGEWYDDKPTRLRQLLERLIGNVLIVANENSFEEICECLQGLDLAHAKEFSLWTGAEVGPTAVLIPPSPPQQKKKQLLRACLAVAGKLQAGGAHGFQYLVHYDVPPTGSAYVQYLAPKSGQRASDDAPEYIYTFIEESDVSGRKCKSISAVLRRALKAARSYGDGRKATELVVSLQSLGCEREQTATEDADDEEPADADEEDDEPPLIHDHFAGQCSISYHAATPCALASAPLVVEVVRLPLRALEHLDVLAPILQPRLQHSCTIVCCHNLNCLSPWDGHEHLFALPAGMGSVRVVLVLADDGSYHDYLDLGAYESGVVWVDFMDAPTMLETDALLEKLVDLETALLGGQSRRIVLFGKSQGGGQCLLRMLRSKQELGGYIGGMCHAPIAPHISLDADPIAAIELSGCAAANAKRPIRLLCGEDDTIFAPPMVLSDMERLRRGGFLDVEVLVQPGLTHEDVLDSNGCWADENAPPPELEFLRTHLPKALRVAVSEVQSVVTPCNAVPGTRRRHSVKNSGICRAPSAKMAKTMAFI